MCWVSARRLEPAHNRIILLRVVSDESSIEPCGVEAGLAQASFPCNWGRERGVQRCLVRRLLHRGRFRRQRRSRKGILDHLFNCCWRDGCSVALLLYRIGLQQVWRRVIFHTKNCQTKNP